ncbi:MAG: hypothetical protein ACO2O0_07120 [Desulfurococcales archaeon]
MWCIYRYSREAIYFGAPEAEALDGGSAPIEPQDPRVDGSSVPLGSTAINETTGVFKTLWGRWKSPDATGLKTLWIGKRSNTKQRNISDNQQPSGTSGYASGSLLSDIGAL